jgi:EpsI family protein
MASEVNPISHAGPESRSTRRDFLVGGALIATAVLAARGSLWGESRPTPLARSLADIVPDRFGPWRSSPANGVVMPTAETPAETGYDDLLTRYFVNEAGRTIMFLVAYGAAQSGNTQLHRPEACYPAAGFSLGDSVRTSLEDRAGTKIDARALTATKPGRVEQILYWSRVGAAFPTDSASQSLAVIRQSLGGSAPDGALVRISTLGSDRGSALTLLRLFANDLLKQPAPSLRRLLTGRG